MNRTVLLIGLGGFLGSLARYFSASYFNRILPSSFPFGTFIANLTGCFIIGIIYGIADRFHWLTPEWRFFLATGFCGGYTTFSAFAYENLELLQASNYMMFAIYSLTSFTSGLLAVFIGLSLTKL